MLNRGDSLIDRVDRHDRAVGIVRRKDALRHSGFRVVHVLLVDPNGNLLLQRIASGHDRHPGYWGSSVAGYVQAGESYGEAAARKLRDEAGVVGSSQKFLGKMSMQDESACKFIAVFTASIARSAVRPNPADFGDYAFVPMTQVTAELVSGARQFTPTFREVMRFAIPLMAARAP